MTTRILLIGSSSLVGSHLVEAFGNKYEISAIGRKNIFVDDPRLTSFKTLDIRNKSELQETILSSKAEFIVNYAAETNVDKCEEEKDNMQGNAYTTNVASVLWIAEACRDSGKKLIQISTDFVFDGSSGPYSESDRPGPINTGIGWYGYTKYLAEKEIERILPSGNCIIRISYPYRASFRFKSDFARNIISLYEKSALFPLFTDQIFSPTLIDDVSLSVDLLIRKNLMGAYHVACRQPTTPYEFASKLITIFFASDNSSKLLKKGSIIEFNKSPNRAPRPVRGGLNTDKIQSQGLVPKSYEEGILAMYEQCHEK